MPDIVSVLVLFAVGSAAGFINVMAGGGSTLTLPTLIFLGLDASVANGTNRIAIIIQNISAVYSFKREKYSSFRVSIKLALLTLPGAVIGTIAAVNIADDTFETILGIVMIGIIITMILPGKKLKFADEENKKITVPVYIAMFLTGFYGGFLQVGVGFIIMASLQYLMKLNLVFVNMHKVFIVLIYTIPALLIFVVTGNVNWQFGLALAAGNALGGWWAARFAVKKGEKIIKIVLIAAVFIMALKLLNLF